MVLKASSASLSETFGLLEASFSITLTNFISKCFYRT